MLTQLRLQVLLNVLIQGRGCCQVTKVKASMARILEETSDTTAHILLSISEITEDNFTLAIQSKPYLNSM